MASSVWSARVRFRYFVCWCHFARDLFVGCVFAGTFWLGSFSFGAFSPTFQKHSHMHRATLKLWFVYKINMITIKYMPWLKYWLLNRQLCTAQVRTQSMPSEQEQQRRQRLCTWLETYIRQSYPTAQLQLFGSSCNGFGTPHSDLDVSMTFSDVSITAGYHDC